MAILSPTLLETAAPRALVPAKIKIGHVQLRDLVICPRERGVVNYVQEQSIMEQKVNHREDSRSTILVKPDFAPISLTALHNRSDETTLYVAGGHYGELHASLHRQGEEPNIIWQQEQHLKTSINNSVFLTHARTDAARVGVSNNDRSVRFFEVPLRASTNSWQEVGHVKSLVPVNHSSLSPDGSTLLSVGDSSKVNLHHVSGSSQMTFRPIATLTLPPPRNSSNSNLAASFSTAFSSDGTKYAVGSQEGLVAVWDVRSTKPLKVFYTDTSASNADWSTEDPWAWTRGISRGPGWSVRSVKFGGHGAKEMMVFTEHTGVLHVVDARTFEVEETMNVPRIRRISSRNRSASPTPVPAPPIAENPASPQPAPIYPYYSHRVPSAISALEDTFRLFPRSSPSPHPPYSPWQHHEDRSSQSPSSRRLAASQHRRRSAEDVVVVPPLGDREIESDVQALLGRYGFQSRRSQSPTPETYRNNPISWHETTDRRSPSIESLASASSVPGNPLLSAPAFISATSTSDTAAAGPTRSSGLGYRRDSNDVDIAGVCFDPEGTRVYVGSTGGIAEWAVRGADKTWWTGDRGDGWL